MSSKYPPFHVGVIAAYVLAALRRGRLAHSTRTSAGALALTPTAKGVSALWSIAAFFFCLSMAHNTTLAQSGSGNRTRRELTLAVGEQSSIPAENVRSYSEGVQGIVDVRLPRDGSQFVILALRAGATTLLLIMNDGTQVQYRITVQGEAARPDVESKDNIRLDLYFVQVSETYQHQIGVGFPAGILSGATFGGTFSLGAGVPSSASINAQGIALPHLDILQATGWARIQRQAALITTNGSEATYESGGEMNVRIQGALTATMQVIRYGSQIQVLPRYDRQTGRVEMRIVAEVADLTEDHGTGIPGRTRSHLEALINVQAGQSVVLAGLTSDSEQRSKSGLPGLSQIPILGIFFGSHGRQVERLRNVLIIVPTVVDTVSARSHDRIREAMHVYDEYRGDIDEANLMESIRPAPNAETAPRANGPLIVPSE